MNHRDSTAQLASLSSMLNRDLEEQVPTGFTVEVIGSVINDLRELEGLERRSDLDWVG